MVDATGAALQALLERLGAEGYRFTAITPSTHQRVLSRALAGWPSLRDVFGWSRPFAAGDLDPSSLALLAGGGALERDGDSLRSAVRVASAGGRLFLHSAFPTTADDAVFFGPDTYRYLRLIERFVPALGPLRRIVDMGAGSGAGGIHAAALRPGARVTLVDINPAALRLARINAAVAGIDAECVLGGRIAAVEGAIDLVIANPPYMIDPERRAYRDGGGLLGGEIALNWVEEALGRLEPGGSVLLYTGAAVVEGRMPLAEALEQLCSDRQARMQFEEIDPDVFGEELDGEPYRNVERIAAIGALITAA